MSKSVKLLILLMLFALQQTQQQQPQQQQQQQVLAKNEQIVKIKKMQTKPSTPISQPFGLRNLQLVLYDPRSGRQLEPLSYMPAILTGNKRKPLEQANGNVVQLPQLWNPCSCTEYFCICCLGLRIGENFINQQICAALQYNVAETLLKLTVTINQRSVANIDVSARNPAPWCMPILLPLPVYACLRLYDVRVANGNAQLCISLILSIASQQLFQFPFDCVRFGAAGIAFMPPSSAVSTNTGINDENPMVAHGGGDGDGGYGAVGENGNNDDDNDDDILEIRENIQLEENYSGISVEQQQQHPFTMNKRARG